MTTTPSPLLALARRPLRRAVHDARHVAPVPYRRASGPVRRVYDAVERDFGMLAPPVAVHSPAPVVMAAVWRLLRSTLLVPGATTRAEREAVATAVSRANRCPYCVEVHDASHRAVGTALDGEPAPGPGHAELTDVAATFEYLNRVVTVFLPASPVPAAAPPAARRHALAMLGTAARREVPGRRTAPADLLLDDVAAAAAAGLPDAVAIRAAVDRGLARPAARLEDTSRDVAADAPAAVRAPARLAVLSATAPWRVTGEVIEDARAAPGVAADGALVAVVALGAATAAQARRAALVRSGAPGEEPDGLASRGWGA